MFSYIGIRTFIEDCIRLYLLMNTKNNYATKLYVTCVLLSLCLLFKKILEYEIRLGIKCAVAKYPNFRP